ncbi:hypothetical protein V5799_015149 [Amblyomma americanum]|uniref:DDE Tnp4 domain-containing protein n=1 Tax=Amblyomma americanum TaxID=6943 RepID=A0AAQ4E0Z6_AMBAM
MDQRRASLSAVVATLVTSILDSSSSSSSSDSEEELVLNQLLSFVQNPSKKRRLGDCITKPLLECSDDEFFQDFRLRRRVVVSFIERYARSSFYIRLSDHGGLPQKSPEEHILCFLWYATNKVCIKDVAVRFCISESTVYGIIERLLDYLCSLQSREICFTEDLNLLADAFEQISGFPGVVGCIGGTCINTRSPANVLKPSNRQSLASVRLQAVCDSRCRFMDVFVGPPGDLESESVFLASPLAEELPYWCQDKFHLLGDRGYPLREYLLTPYDDDQGTRDLAEQYEVVFNERHGRTRAKIDDAFMLLRQRFRQLHFLEFVTASKMRRFIMACCVVHNICVEAGDIELEFELTETDGDRIMTVCSESDAEAEEKDERELGSLKRERLAQSFVT